MDSLKDFPAKSVGRFNPRGQRHSAIFAISSDGPMALKLVDDSVNGDTFVEFLRNELVPALNPFNGVNPHSVVVLGE